MKRMLVATLLATALPAAASDKGWSAECDRDRRSVRIEVPAQHAAARPVVYLDGYDRPLEVREWAAGAIVAVLPQALVDGAYRILLREAGAVLRIVEVPLVVGIVGPAIVE